MSVARTNPSQNAAREKGLKDRRDGCFLAFAARFGDETTDDRLKDSAGCCVNQRDRIQCLKNGKISGDQETPHPKMEGKINPVGQAIENK